MGHTKGLSFLLFLLLILPGLSQTSYGQTENQPGTWMVLSVNSKLDHQWSIPVVGILKHQNMLDDYGFAFIRTGMSCHISNRSTITGGMAFLNSNTYIDQEWDANSSQIWYYGEYSLKLPIGEGSILQRMRIENRRTIGADAPQINNRLRYQLQYTRPLGGSFYFKTFNELFLQLENSNINQNRFYMGVGKHLSPSTRMDIGYFNQQVNDEHQHMVRLAFTVNLEFNKKDLALK